MTCTRCGQEIAEDAAFCQFCGAGQHAPSGGHQTRPLRRSLVDRQVAGVCGGIARYFDTDPVFIRVAWVVLSIIPGAILLGLLAYLVAWLIIPEAHGGEETLKAGETGDSWPARRLRRSGHDAKLGGVCGGLAEYFDVDSTVIRVLWVVLSIFPGAIICGVLTYIVAWFIMPAAVVVPPMKVEAAPAAGSQGAR